MLKIDINYIYQLFFENKILNYKEVKNSLYIYNFAS